MAAKSVYGSTLLMFVCAIIFGVSVGTPHWSVWTAGAGGLEVDVYGGLWQICSTTHVGSSSTTNCDKIEVDCDNDKMSSDSKENCNDFQTTRAFAVIAVVAAAIAWFFQLLLALDKTPRAFLPGLLCSVLAGASGMVAFAVYASNPSGDDVKYGYSFGLEIVGSVLALFSGLLFWYGGRASSYFSF